MVGLTSGGGTGSKYWGPISVVANSGEPPAYMAQEDFKADSIVDVKPYVPLNWHPEYPYLYFGTGKDTSGFVYDSAQRTLTYRHKEGVTYPVTCRLLPHTNLEFRDYEFSGWIVKPPEAAYDSIEPGVVFYYQNEDATYRLRFGKNGTVYLTGGGFASAQTASYSFANDDSVFFRVSVSTEASGDTPDAETKMTVKVRKGGDPFDTPLFTDKVDDGDGHRLGGACGITVNLYAQRPSAALRFSAFTLAKTK